MSILITRPDVLTRNWGDEIVVAFTDTHAGKILKRKAGTKGGFQFHLKEENHYLYEGKLLLRTLIDGCVNEMVVEAGTGWTVEPFTVHQEEALTDCLVFEVSDPTRDDRYPLEPDPGGLPAMTNEQAAMILRQLWRAFDDRAMELLGLTSAVESGVYRLEDIAEAARWPEGLTPSSP